MTNENVRLAWHDPFMERTFFWAIPRSLVPNHFTALRFLLTPFVLYFVAIGDWNIAIPLFFIATFTDAVDGSLARTRRQITLWGTIADPVADKLLISSVLLLFVAEELSLALRISRISGVRLLLLSISPSIPGHYKRNKPRVESIGFGNRIAFGVMSVA